MGQALQMMSPLAPNMCILLVRLCPELTIETRLVVAGKCRVARLYGLTVMAYKLYGCTAEWRGAEKEDYSSD